MAQPQTAQDLGPDADGISHSPAPAPAGPELVVDSVGRLLIAEDEPAIRELLEDQFADETGYRVTVVPDGKDALEAFKASGADVIISDVRMPRMSGLELLREIKHLDPRVPVIMMSGFGDIQEAITALRNGAVDFFQKPFTMSRLLASVNRAFNQIAASQLRKVARSYLVEEKLRFCIPNDLDIVPHLIAELTGPLQNDPGIRNMELEGIRAALHEMILNAIEHGNLEISYDEKSALMESPDGWRHEVQRRGLDPAFASRTVTIEAENTLERLSFKIADMGKGFDHTTLPDPTQFTHVLHGRGILIARVHMDEVHYNDSGSSVELVKFKKRA